MRLSIGAVCIFLIVGCVFFAINHLESIERKEADTLSSEHHAVDFFTIELDERIDLLSVRAEYRERPYDRNAFGRWIDDDTDGCNTRKEVLIDESLTPLRIGPDCSLIGGSWYSAYDGTMTSDASKFDIDHLVPLAEAWRSGAYAWDSKTRKAFANDLTHTDALIAVSASANRKKSDKDPSEWMPSRKEFACEYIEMWVNVKLSWNLSVDENELIALKNQSQTCSASR